MSSFESADSEFFSRHKTITYTRSAVCTTQKSKLCEMSFREDPNITKAGRHRPASETPFDGLGSSREHTCENSLNFRGIAMGLYRGWRGGGGSSVSQSSLASLDPRMHEDYAFVCVC